MTHQRLDSALPVSIPSGNGTAVTQGAVPAVPGSRFQQSCDHFMDFVDKKLSRQRIDFELRLQHRTREEL